MSEAYSFMTWELANQQLRDLLVDAKSFLLEEIDFVAKSKGINYSWLEASAWESRTDEELLRILLDGLVVEKAITAVPDACFSKRLSPFSVSGRDLNKFAQEFLNEFGESLFNGDVVVLIPEGRCIALFQHDGYYARVFV